MAKLNPKQLAFAKAKVAGCTNRDAAITAGYAVAGADVQANRLMKHPGVRNAIKAAAKANPGVDINPDTAPRMLPKYGSSLELLRHTYNNARMPDAMRIRAAEQALPYEHPKMGEVGKKEKTKERAHEIAGKGGKHKFAPKSAPTSNVVPIRQQED